MSLIALLSRSGYRGPGAGSSILGSVLGVQVFGVEELGVQVFVVEEIEEQGIKSLSGGPQSLIPNLLQPFFERSPLSTTCNTPSTKAK